MILSAKPLRLTTRKAEKAKAFLAARRLNALQTAPMPTTQRSAIGGRGSKPFRPSGQEIQRLDNPVMRSRELLGPGLLDKQRFELLLITE